MVNAATADPDAKCFEPGVPRVTYEPYPFQIVQTPAYVAVLYEYDHVTRHIYVDGSPHPKGPIDFWLMGDSRARWEGNTLVVDVIHFSDQTWLDHAGNFHSPALHVVERYTPIDRDHRQRFQKCRCRRSAGAPLRGFFDDRGATGNGVGP